jgi:hypothetical protein
MPSSVLAWAATLRPDSWAACHQRVHLHLRKGGVGAAVGAAAVVGVELDPVGAARALLAHRACHLVDAAGFLRALRQVDIGAVAARRRPIAAGGDDRAGGDEQARAGNDAVVNRLLDRHIGIQRAFGAEVAQGGESGLQGGGGVAPGQQGAVFHRFL